MSCVGRRHHRSRRRPSRRRKGTNERHFTITGDGTAQVRSPSGQPQWTFSATADRAPTIALAKDPERQARGSLQMSYKLEDDYGVTEAQARFAAAPSRQGRAKGGAAPRPLFDAAAFPLALPNARTRNGVGQTVKDLSEDPYAGADVTLTLTAKDEAGNEGKSEPFNMRLPERLFTKPLARALIEQRRILALDANQNRQVLCRARCADDRAGIVHAGGRPLSRPHSVARQLEAARTDDALREVVAQPVGARGHDRGRQHHRCRQGAARRAGGAEAGAGARRQRRGDQEAHRQSARGAGQFPAPARRADAEQSAATGAAARSQYQVMRQQDLKNMIDRMERLSRSGDKDAAKQLLEQMQQMLENLQMAQPGQSGDGEMQQALNELGDMIRKQQQLRDKTFKQGQDSRRERQRGRAGRPEHGRPAAGPAGPARSAEASCRRNSPSAAWGRASSGEKGQRGQQGQQGSKARAGRPGRRR